MKETIGKRIKRYRLASKQTQQKVADALKISRVAVSKWESGQTKDLKKDNLIGLAKLFHCSIEELLTGIDYIEGECRRIDENVLQGPSIKTEYPLISWVQAGAFCGVVDLYQPGDAERFVSSTKIHGPHTYVLRVEGDSMVNPFPGQRTYLPGCLIFVDPDRSVTNGCRVIAKLPAEDAATFKVYAEDGGKRYLKPLNPQYPTIEMTPDIQICGVVVAMTMEE